MLLADQWIATGGAMDGAIRLIDRLGGIVVGIAAVAIEENEVTAGYCRRYLCVAGFVSPSAIQPNNWR